ncbi:MAG TPA: FtsX-like permease family protein, partial [Kofleriaceae bacterium]
MKNDSDRVQEAARRRRTHAWTELLIGIALVVAGLIATRMAKDLKTYLAAAAPIVLGFAATLRGMLRLLAVDAAFADPTKKVTKTHGSLNLGFGFKSFVAWRYLMARDHRFSRIVLSVLVFALFIDTISYTAARTLVSVANPLNLDHDALKNLGLGFLIAMVIGTVLIYFALIIGALRWVFSFFTTVPLVGVWIGTGALVCVLAVMSGFETDLREKILGSNAHINITRDDGADFTNWRDIKAKVDKVPGVVASSPYAMREVVIAASGNGMNVIIKGIDVATVGKVTDLINDLKDKDAINRLEPLVDDTHDLTVPDKPQQGSGGIDPPPADMPGTGEPIDFSQPKTDVVDPNQPPSVDDSPPTEPPPPPLDERPPPLAGDPDTQKISPYGNPDIEKISPYGGDATVVQKPTVDPPPPDLVVSDEAPQDFSGRDDEDVINAIDVPMEPSLSRRTQSLPGILVGAELVKQTHLYTGEEVRIVSPLSDPANPDATGTPIPFNRDYRVAGTFYTGMYEYDLKYVYVTIDSLTDFLDRGDVVDGIEVRIGSPDDTDEYVSRLSHLLGKQYRIQDWKELNRSLFSALKLEKIAMFLVLGIVILVASFSIVGNLIMVVVEKAREIALLKTLGASDTGVMHLFAIQGLMIGLIGTGLGVAAGLLGAWRLAVDGFPINPDVYYINRLPVEIDFFTVGLVFVAG